MRFFHRETWAYAVLLIILFAIATIAVVRTLNYVEHYVSGDEFKVITIAMSALTLGFMLIAGAFGLWAIRFSAESESRRRIGRLVDAMDYLEDGIVAIDGRGRITAANPAMRALLGRQPEERTPISSLFPCLSDNDVKTLLDKHHTSEIEREFGSPDNPRIIRFRSQPSTGLNLVLLSDVTSMNAEQERTRQRARLQLIGQIARGAAHDFNNLLCSISGYTALLNRMPPGSPETATSLEAITRGAEKGIALAGHLLELCDPGLIKGSTEMIHTHVDNAATALRNSLPSQWQVERDLTEDLPAAALTGVQIEQVILNLAWLIADQSQGAKTMRLKLTAPGADHLSQTNDNFAAIILISAAPLSDGSSADSLTAVNDEKADSGIIQSVIGTMLEQNGGRLDKFVTPDGSTIFRVSLPRASMKAETGDNNAELTAELTAYIESWKILVAHKKDKYAELDKRIAELKLETARTDSITSTLAAIEEDTALDAMIIDSNLLGPEPRGLLKAILKLKPSAGLVVLCEDPQSMEGELSSDIVFVRSSAPPDRMLISIIDARTRAYPRKASIAGN